MPNSSSFSTPYDVSIPRRPVCVLTGCDDKFACILFTAINSFLKNSPKLAEQTDIWVAGINLSEKSKKILAALPHTRIFDYVFLGKYPQNEPFRNFTQGTFVRYECFTLLHFYQKVIYLDSDMLVLKELSPVFDSLTNGIGLVPDPDISPMGRNFTQPIAGFDMNACGFNAGFMALKQGADWGNRLDEIKDFLYTKTCEYADYLIYPDQGILHLAMQQFQLKPTTLPLPYNCPASESYSNLNKAVIVHASGPRKFWGYYYFNDFYQYYTQWIQQGGAKVSVRKSDSELYKKFIRSTGLDKYIFVQLCPDFLTKPGKALRFGIKKLFHCKF